MADMMTKVFGESLVYPEDLGFLPSPEELKYKVIEIEIDGKERGDKGE